MDYKEGWQAPAASAETEHSQGRWDFGSENAAWAQLSEATGQGSAPGAWQIAQPHTAEREHMSSTEQGTEESSHDPPPLPPGGPPNDAGDQPPPLPQGPPPLPPEAPPPLPGETSPSMAPQQPGLPMGGSSYDYPSQRQLDVSLQMNPQDQRHAQPDLSTSAIDGHQDHQSHADDHAQAAYNAWQTIYYQQPPASEPEQQTSHMSGAHTMQPDAYGSTYQYADGNWQTPQYPPEGAYAGSLHQQYQLQYQQPTQQHPWQHPAHATWHHTSATATQYPLPTAYPGAGQYLYSDASQQAFPGYQTVAYVPGSVDPYAAVGSHQSEPVAAMPSAAAAAAPAAAGLSGPSQAPIVVVHAVDLFEMPGCAKRPKKVCFFSVCQC